jgi:D-glycero-D-manno-heptose 1,7-bisphosphate phosphatase
VCIKSILSQPAADCCVFLDRDGVINERDPSGYVVDPSKFRFRSDSLPALQMLADRLPLVVVTNQRCVSLGLLARDTLHAVMRVMSDGMERAGAPVTAWYACPHDTSDSCGCRKPLPGMLRSAAADLQLDLARCYLIGDRESDVAAGEAAGCRLSLQIDDRAEGALAGAAGAVIADLDARG